MKLRTPVAAAVLAATIACSTAFAAQANEATPPAGVDMPTFDIQGHRGGLGLRTENSVASFSNALELGVTTLELDAQITKDGYAVVTHDRKTTANNCKDTAPATAGDPMYPYIGKYIKDLTLAQIRTFDCGSIQKGGYPQQQTSPGSKMMLLTEVFDLVRAYGADDVKMNIETKVEAGAPQETAPRAQFVQVVTDAIREYDIADQVSIQSFDWGALMLVRETMPELPIVALTNGNQFLQPGKPGASPWLGGIDIDDFGGDLVAAAHSFGADAISPVDGTPQGGAVSNPKFVPYTNQKMVDDAHAAGMKVIPWTIDDPETLEYFIDMGVDGIITDYPNRLRDILGARGYALPRQYANQNGGISLQATVVPLAAGEGVLTLSVPTGTTAFEGGALRGDRRVFDAQLPVISVTDTRDDTRSDGWSVTGRASDLLGGEKAVGAQYIGWTPSLVTPRDSVSAGQSVEGLLSGGTGIGSVSGLALADADAETGTTEVTAGLSLEVPVATQAGHYEGTMTVSLFPTD